MSKLIWGILITLFGLYLILSELFNFNFPLFKVLFAVLIIFLGFKLLFGSFGLRSSKEGESVSIFSAQRVEPQNLNSDQEYSCVFGAQDIDLTNTGLTKDNLEIEVNAVFGRTNIYLPKNASVRVKSSAVFGRVSNPDGNSVTFGDAKYRSNENSDKLFLNVEANAVFGSVNIYQ